MYEYRFRFRQGWFGRHRLAKKAAERLRLNSESVPFFGPSRVEKILLAQTGFQPQPLGILLPRGPYWNFRLCSFVAPCNTDDNRRVTGLVVQPELVAGSCGFMVMESLHPNDRWVFTTHTTHKCPPTIETLKPRTKAKTRTRTISTSTAATPTTTEQQQQQQQHDNNQRYHH